MTGLRRSAVVLWGAVLLVWQIRALAFADWQIIDYQSGCTVYEANLDSCTTWEQECNGWCNTFIEVCPAEQGNCIDGYAQCWCKGIQ